MSEHDSDVERHRLAVLDPGVTPPPCLDHHERMRLRVAASRAKQVYPGAVGMLISQELLVWEQFGFRFGSAGLVTALMHDVMTKPMPVPPTRTGSPTR